MSATGPAGRGCVLAVAGAVVVLAVEVPLLLDEHAANVITAHASATVAVSGVVRLRMGTPWVRVR
jgi:hypothetical protein